ncbi:MAG: carboxypeptidase regulatory-like domain-containing protein [Planctomycetota bacterium]
MRIHSDRGAMTCSSFRIDADGLVLTVTLGRGVRVTGTIVDSHGNPVPAATIDVVEPPSVGPLVFICSRNPSPTRPWTTADEHGRFALDHVTPGRYCVRVRHPALSERTLPAVSLEADGQALDLGFVELQQGAIFEGTCTVNGRPAGQIKVMIGPPNGYRPEVDSEGRPVTPMFSASAITDGDGTYRFLTRVPPGTYKIHAFKEAGGDDVFSRFQQMKETERQLVVAPGQEQSVQNFNLSN